MVQMTLCCLLVGSGQGMNALGKINVKKCSQNKRAKEMQFKLVCLEYFS